MSHYIEFFSAKESVKVELEQKGAWQEVVVRGSKFHALRTTFRKAAERALPLGASRTFPISNQVVLRLYFPWGLANTFERIRSIIEGFIEFARPARDPYERMKLLLPDGRYESVEKVARLGCYLNPPCDKATTISTLIDSALKIDELMLFHFLTKRLPKQSRIVLMRELAGGKILSEVSRNNHPFFKNKQLGITGGLDRERNDHYYVHCFIAYPLVSNRRRIQNRILFPLSRKSRLELAFQNRAEAVLLPFDMQQLRTHECTFLSTRFSVRADSARQIVSYEQDGRLLLEHSFADETFFGSTQDVVGGLFRVFAKIIERLDLSRQSELAKDPALLKELFNSLFAFRVQLSVPQELDCQPYSHPSHPKVALQSILAEDKIFMPDLSAAKSAFLALCETLEPSVEPCEGLTELLDHFRTPFFDGTNTFQNGFGYYGGISAQIWIHFWPKMTRDLLCTIIRLHKADPLHPSLVVKTFEKSAVTLFSLIEKSFDDLDVLQLRQPPNSRFDMYPFEAETLYLDQLQNLYNSGSRILAILGTGQVPFSQNAHREATISHGIKRLLYPVRYDFSNSHGYTEEGFAAEFSRGMDALFRTFEVQREGVQQAHIVDFVKRLVEGEFLVEPRFKHDLLDAKHFAAGMLSTTLYFFVDGECRFRELIIRVLYEIGRQKRVSLNASLLIDAVYLFLKSQPSSDGMEPLKTLDQDAREYVHNELARYSAEELPFVQESLSLLQLHIRKKVVSKFEVETLCKAIYQKIHNLHADPSTERYFNLIPSFNN
ncbi:MAG: hypothetical protein JSS12_09265 [Verrucomicrobia bacterium]|nr:hypothetical protein [Verrucomicrobiota bacterium]